MQKLLLAFILLLNVIYAHSQVQCLNEDFESFNSQSDLVSITGDPLLTWRPIGFGLGSDLVSNIIGNPTQFLYMVNCGIWDPVTEPHGGHDNSVIALPLSCSVNPCDKVKVSIDTRAISTSFSSNLYNSDVYVNMRLVENNPLVDCTGGLLASCVTATTNYTDIRFDISNPTGGWGPWETFTEYIDNHTSNTYNYVLVWFDHVPAAGCYTQGLDNVKLEVIETFEESVNIDDIIYGCANNYEEICGPSGANYTYEWYGTTGTTNNLLWEGQCFTPSQAGTYILNITDSGEEYACYNSQTITVIDGIPLPILADGDQICIGDLISINGQGFDNPNYNINWHHNGTLVQTGGTVLQTSFTSGYITVQVSYNDCEPVSTTVQLVKCCPEDIELSVDCENHTIVLENLPINWPVSGMEWTFNGSAISPQPTLTSTLNAYLGDGTYGVIILYQLDNGKYCKIKVSVEYNEENCCAGSNPDAEVTVLDATTMTVDETPYGPMVIPVVSCDLTLDGSASTCEDSYHITIEPWDPGSWTGTGAGFIYDVWYSGQAPNSIPIPSGIFPPTGGFYLLTFAVGPVYNPEYVLFWYSCEDAKGASKSTSRRSNTEQEIVIYPNPTNDVLNLKSKFDTGTYEIYDVHGKLIQQEVLSSKETTIDLSGLSSGIYFFRIQSDEGAMYFEKVIKN